MECQEVPNLEDTCKDVMDEEADAPAMTQKENAELAETKKLIGNEHYQSKNYKEALSLYTEAIGLCPQCAAYYGNRAATLMMLGRYTEALKDARMSTDLDQTFTKGYIRQSKCYLMLGDALSAEIACHRVLKFEPNNHAVQNDINTCKLIQHMESLANKAFVLGDHRQALHYLNRLLEQSPQSLRFKTRRAEALVYLRRYQEATETINDVVQRESMNADALYIRGLCLYYQDNVDKAFSHFQEVLRLAPDHNIAKTTYKKVKLLRQLKESGNDLFRQCKYEDAYQKYTEALDVDPLNQSTNSKLYFNRATVCAKLARMTDSITDCSKAIELDEKYTKAYLRRARSYLDTQQYEEAVRDYETVYKMDKTRENKRLVDEAKLELKKSKRKDYYKILGVDKNANQADIKKAYRKRALIHHPDRHSNATPDEQKEEERKFKEVGEAYSVLSDEKKKGRYDNGLDLDEMDHGFGDVDPSQIFQAFFGGGMPGGFAHAGHSHGHPGHQQFFTPGGGFHFQF